MQSDMDQSMKQAIFSERIMGGLIGEEESIKHALSIIDFMLDVLEHSDKQILVPQKQAVEAQIIEADQSVNRRLHGSKAANLQWLMNMGFDVPIGFSLSAQGAPVSETAQLSAETQGLLFEYLKN